MEFSPQSLKALLFTDADVFAGTERHMLDLARSLRDLSVPVSIGCPAQGVLGVRAREAGFPVVHIAKQGQIDFPAIRQLRRLLESGEIDLIHAHNGRTHVAAAWAVAGARRGACIATQHFLSPARTGRSGLKAMLAAFLHRRAMKSTAHVIAISDAVRDAAIARGEVTPEKITTVHNGIFPPAQAQDADPGTVRKSLGISFNAPLIVCAARLQKEKDIPTLIAAMRAVATRVPGARCLIAGDGDQRPILQDHIDRLGLRESVTLLGFRADVADLLNACDLFALPSLAEPFGLALVEAMALGKPVIATRAGGPREIVDHGRTGLLVTPSNPESLAAAISDLLGDNAKRHAMGAAARERYLQKFTAAAMAGSLLEIYLRAVERRGPVQRPSTASSQLSMSDA